MNKTQIEYAHRRIDKMLADRESEARAKHAIAGKSVTSEERVALIRSGKVKLRSDVERIDVYTDVIQVFDFSKFEWPKSYDKEAAEKELAPLRTEAQALKDSIMLGDATTALNAIELFAKKCGGSK